MRVLITGATGFIGTHLVQKLVAEGYQCRCLVRKDSNLDTLKDISDQLDLFEGELTQKSSLEGVGKDIDAVVHLAAVGHVAAISEESLKIFIDINVYGTKNLIEACLPHQSIKRFIHFSSTAAMGLIKASIVDEETEPHSKTPYQRSKRDSELAAMSYWENEGFPVVILRPCMVYGPGGKGEFLKICRLVKKGIFPKVGLGMNLTPAVYVTDVVQAAYLSLENSIPGNTYLVAFENSFELDRIRETVLIELGIKRFYPYVPKGLAVFGAGLIELGSKIFKKEPIVTRQNIASTFTDRVFNINKAKRELGYSPGVDIQKGINYTIEWYKGQNLI